MGLLVTRFERHCPENEALLTMLTQSLLARLLLVKCATSYTDKASYNKLVSRSLKHVRNSVTEANACAIGPLASAPFVAADSNSKADRKVCKARILLAFR